MSDWEDIATAPRGGAYVILKDDSEADATRGDLREWRAENIAIARRWTGLWEEGNAGEGEYVFDEWMLPVGPSGMWPLHFEPTHWKHVGFD